MITLHVKNEFGDVVLFDNETDESANATLSELFIALRFYRATLKEMEEDNGK